MATKAAKLRCSKGEPWMSDDGLQFKRNVTISGCHSVDLLDIAKLRLVCRKDMAKSPITIRINL